MIEDFWWFDNSSSMGKDPLLLDHSAYWGDNYFVDTINGQPVKNYFVAQVEKVARYAIPFVKNMQWLTT